MVCGHYIIELDKTGFPLIKRDAWDFFISLFPVSKYQFESFMAEFGPHNNLYTDEWYRKILDINPRISWRESWEKIEKAPWRLFLTGALWEAIRPFLSYLGRGFR